MPFAPPTLGQRHSVLEQSDDVVDAPVNTEAPAITGNTPPALVDALLTVSNGTWENAPTSFSYQWQANSSNIVGATNATYQLTQADAGNDLTCIVTATNAGGSTPQVSNTVVPAVLSVPVVVTPPEIAWTGTQFTIASHGTWSANPVLPNLADATYQWEESSDTDYWGELPGETGTSLTTFTSDYYYRCRVTRTNNQGSGSRTSNHLQAV